jgi:hypothetical protein
LNQSQGDPRALHPSRKTAFTGGLRCSGGFGPMSLPLFQGLRRAVTVLVSLAVSMVLLPFLRRRPSMLLSQLWPGACPVLELSGHDALDGGLG